MHDEMIRKRVHRAMDDCLSGVERMPSQRSAVLARIERKQTRSMKLTAVPVLALVLAVALAGAGVAVGMGLFGQLRASKEQETSYTRLGRLDEAAVCVGQIERLTIPETEHVVELMINQAYCDGRKLYYSYTLGQEAGGDVAVFVGDGAQLLGGEYLSPLDSGDGTTPSGARTAYYEVALPEGIVLGEDITFELTLMPYVNGEYTREKALHVPVTVPVTGDPVVLLGEGQLDGFDAKVKLFVSDVDVSGTVTFDTTESIGRMRFVLMADGVQMEMVDGYMRYGAEQPTFEVRFDLPEDAKDAAYVLTCAGIEGDIALTREE